MPPTQKSRVAAVSLAVGYPTMASLPHSINNAFKMLLAVTVECENYTFDQAEPFKVIVHLGQCMYTGVKYHPIAVLFLQ